MVKILRVLRVLRPLRAINRAKGLKVRTAITQHGVFVYVRLCLTILLVSNTIISAIIFIFRGQYQLSSKNTVKAKMPPKKSLKKQKNVSPEIIVYACALCA